MHVSIRAGSCKGSSHSEKTFDISLLLSAFLFALMLLFEPLIKNVHRQALLVMVRKSLV